MVDDRLEDVNFFLYMSDAVWLSGSKNEKHLLCLLRWDFLGMSESLQQIANMAQWHAGKKNLCSSPKNNPGQ